MHLFLLKLRNCWTPKEKLFITSVTARRQNYGIDTRHSQSSFVVPINILSRNYYKAIHQYGNITSFLIMCNVCVHYISTKSAIKTQNTYETIDKIWSKQEKMYIYAGRSISGYVRHRLLFWRPNSDKFPKSWCMKSAICLMLHFHPS